MCSPPQVSFHRNLSPLYTLLCAPYLPFPLGITTLLSVSSKLIFKHANPFPSFPSHPQNYIRPLLQLCQHGSDLCKDSAASGTQHLRGHSLCGHASSVPYSLHLSPGSVYPQTVIYSRSFLSTFCESALFMMLNIQDSSNQIKVPVLSIG